MTLSQRGTPKLLGAAPNSLPRLGLVTWNSITFYFEGGGHILGQFPNGGGPSVHPQAYLRVGMMSSARVKQQTPPPPMPRCVWARELYLGLHLHVVVETQD